ncbi:hypothetical protein llap_6762 [Limosa lapponica baueri]|uniref:Rna-directed dna polymerase from mobile element jockey-like n=1 Tax=Limosa lapponica baueri TaxID=1758121 RepID=A0A2I0UA69_LIMLA|nr:hypothetical protein llap_6762 [Limosa lapponica baueri]
MPSRGTLTDEEKAHVNLMKFNKAKCKVLHLGHNNPQYEYRLEDELIERSPVEKNLGIPLDAKLDMSQQCTLTAQKANSWFPCSMILPGTEVLQMVSNLIFSYRDQFLIFLVLAFAFCNLGGVVRALAGEDQGKKVIEYLSLLHVPDNQVF